jgi:hypothetical protein
MWEFVPRLILLLVAGCAILIAVPVCLGLLLRLLIRKPRARLVAWLGAALILAAYYCAGNRNSLLADVAELPPPADDSLVLMFLMGAIGFLVPVAMVYYFVERGVDAADGQVKKPSFRFWLVACPIIATTVNAGLLFALLSLLPILEVSDRFAYALITIYQYMGWELLYVPCAAVVIVMISTKARGGIRPSSI